MSNRNRAIAVAGANPAFTESNYFEANLPLENLDSDGTGGANNIQDFTITLQGTSGIIDEKDVHLPLFQEIPAYVESTRTDDEIHRKLTKDTTSLFISDELLGDLAWDVTFQERLLNEDPNAENMIWIRSRQGDSAQFSAVTIPGAVWLFGTGMIRLVGLCKKCSS